MEINAAETPHNSIYKILTGAVVPRPIAWVSTLDADGKPNLAPFSFFNAVCSNPPTLLFCPSIRGTDGARKDTYHNVRATGEFVINIVTEDTAAAMNISATELPSGANEFEMAQLTPAPSMRVKAPRVLESPVNFECKLTQIVEIGDGSPGSGAIIIGEVLHVHVAAEVMLPDYKIDIAKLKPIGRLAGFNYARISDIFEMKRLPTQIKRPE
jgi:flavin reductase (DIM6/NTAB) family NADH-FMN oxidoreductase RutF